MHDLCLAFLGRAGQRERSGVREHVHAVPPHRSVSFILLLRVFYRRCVVHLGRSFANELEALSTTYDWAIKTSISDISEFVKRSAGLPLYVVGSGGSLSAATFASMLHRQTGTMSRCITPLEFLDIDGIDGSCAILIVTAGGNNGDILSAFDKAIALRPELLGVLCVSTDNKLTRKALAYPETIIHAARPPIGKDGFLATNSLLATEVWLTRAYANGFSFIDNLPDSPSSLLYDGIPKREFEERVLDGLLDLAKKDTIVILHDSWGGAAAVDAESKLIEAGLVSVQLSDYRNFAHGRHNWLDKNGQRTGVIALVTPRCSRLAAKTVNLIPDSVAVARLSSNFNGPAASLNLLIKIMYTVKFFGTIRKIDPGKPKVAQFGRRIYHLKIPRNDTGISDRERTILLRKFSSIDTKDSHLATRASLLRRFVRRMERTKFAGIILDYDGTMCDVKNRSRGASPEMGACLARMLQNKILVGVATGRGKSIREDLRQIIPKTYWHQLFIGYYNGGDIGYLDDDSVPNISVSMNSHLKTVLVDIRKRDVLLRDCHIDKRPLQISIHPPKISAADLISIMDLDQTDNKVRVVESSHSIDIIPEGVSKLNLLNKMQKEIGQDNGQILCIGDSGRWPGNDFEMLQTKYSLSVDKVSDDGDSCWNILPLGVQGDVGTLEYLRGAEIYDGYFMLHLGVKQ